MLRDFGGIVKHHPANLSQASTSKKAMLSSLIVRLPSEVVFHQVSKVVLDTPK